MKNFILTIFLAGIFLPTTAFAQIASNKPVFQSGTVTPGHVAMFATSGVLMDGGAAKGGAPGTTPNTLNITGPNDPFCINDAPTTSLSGYHQICLGFGALPSNRFEFSMNSYAGAANLPCTFIVNGVTFPCIGTVSGLPFVASEAALALEPSTFSAAIIRLDYTTGNGAPPLLYTSSSSPCTLNSGAGDGGSQVPSSDGNCWIARFGANADVREWGAVPNIDSTTQIQLAINYAQTSNIPLVLGNKIYKINPTGLVCTAPLMFDGENPGSSGTTGTGGFAPTTTNQSGLFTFSSGCNGTTLKNIWLDMNAAGTNTSGEAIVMNQGTDNNFLSNITAVAACTAVSMNGFNPWIVNSYFQHSQSGSGCHGVVIGEQSNNSAGHTTGGGMYNVLVSGTAPTSNTIQQGVLLEDCGGCLLTNVQTIFGTNGLDIHPGGSSGAGQLVASLYMADSSPGDTTVSTNVDINPTTAFGVVRIIHIVHSSISSNSTNAIFGTAQTNPEINIHNDNGGIVRSIVLDGNTIYAGNIGVQVANGVSDVTLVNNHICGYGTNLTGSNYYGVWLGSTVFDVKIQNNTIQPFCDGNLSGTPGYAFHFDGSTPYGIVITGNQLAQQRTSYSDGTQPGWNSSFPTLINVINNNGGLDGYIFGQPSAATISTQINKQLQINTATTTITTIDGCWPGRSIDLFAFGGITPSFATGGNIGAAFTMTANVPAIAVCNVATGTPVWYLK